MTYLWPQGEAITVWSDELATPQTFTWRGRVHRVQGIAQRWRVDQGWWRDRTWREYFKLTTQTGLLVIIYREVPSGAWYLQRLYD
jgi:hypothetical protein